MKIATFNINNVQRRLPVLLAWLKRAKPDIVCLQELKAAQEAFPASAIEDAGFFSVHRGEKTWNGVAILARGAEPILTNNAPYSLDDVSATLGRAMRKAGRSH